MNFWKNVQSAAETGGLVWLVVRFLALAAILFATIPPARTRIRASVPLFALSFFGLLVAGLETLLTQGCIEVER